MCMVDVVYLTGSEIASSLPAIARLRVKIFRAWPYLYDGDEAYEAAYLQSYVRSPRAGVMLATRGSDIVGVSTCLPLADETENVVAPFRAQGIDPEQVFYFGESVLLPELRGQGVGVRFFEARETHARAVSNCDYAAFCSVQRPAEHPARPADFVPLDAFWTKRGFMRRPDLACRMAWKDIGEPEETEKTLVFWMKSLHGQELPPSGSA